MTIPHWPQGKKFFWWLFFLSIRKDTPKNIYFFKCVDVVFVVRLTFCEVFFFFYYYSNIIKKNYASQKSNPLSNIFFVFFHFLKLKSFFVKKKKKKQKSSEDFFFFLKKAVLSAAVPHCTKWDSVFILFYFSWEAFWLQKLFRRLVSNRRGQIRPWNSFTGCPQLAIHLFRYSDSRTLITKRICFSRTYGYNAWVELWN